jgi:hypothetical protein
MFSLKDAIDTSRATDAVGNPGDGEGPASGSNERQKA